MSNVVIIDYGSGNLHSTAKSFEKMAAETGDTILVSDTLDTIQKADKIVLPGVGAFGDCMQGLKAIGGLVDVLEQKVQQDKTPFLGICVGMQLLAAKGYEHGEYEGFGWIDGEVKALKPSDASLKIPHMGWNELHFKAKHPILEGIESGQHAYFVHSFHMECEPSEVLATTDYGQDVTAIVAKGNVVGTQFHPEKSQAVGMQIIHNFLTWDGNA
jgi:glutamine amidotransferase